MINFFCIFKYFNFFFFFDIEFFDDRVVILIVFRILFGREERVVWIVFFGLSFLDIEKDLKDKYGKVIFNFVV